MRSEPERDRHPPVGSANGSADPCDVASRDALRRALLDHYDRHQRRLPWRGERDPYRILVSEVMLQQTRVETVLDYYEAWLGRFPDIDALAAADADDVLRAWEGMGYYRRARNLHRAAQVVRERPDRALPPTYEELRELPGVGEYTAGAVASIAFGERVHAADGNVRRVLARLFDVSDPKRAWLRDTASALVDPERPGDWNQALMELGATICKPRGPRCGRCPVAEWCGAREAGTEEERPAAASRRAPRKAVFAVAVLHDDGLVLLRKRPADGLLGGMWAFPEVEVERSDDPAAAALGIAAELTLEPRGVEALPPCEHAFTHLKASYLPYLLHVGGVNGGCVSEEGPGDAGPPPTSSSPASEVGSEVTWVELSDPAGVALPVAQRRILESARHRLAAEVA